MSERCLQWTGTKLKDVPAQDQSKSKTMRTFLTMFNCLCVELNGLIGRRLSQKTCRRSEIMEGTGSSKTLKQSAIGFSLSSRDSLSGKWSLRGEREERAKGRGRGGG